MRSLLIWLILVKEKVLFFIAPMFLGNCEWFRWELGLSKSLMCFLSSSESGLDQTIMVLFVFLSLVPVVSRV